MATLTGTYLSHKHHSQTNNISGQKMAPEHKYISELTKHHDQDIRDREGEISHQETEPGQGSGDEKHYVEKDYHDSEIPSRKKLKKRKAQGKTKKKKDQTQL